METWRPIKEYEDFYEISDHGNVRSVTRCVEYGKNGRATYRGRMLKLTRLRSGYFCVKLAMQGVTKTRYVHELVAIAFIGDRPSSDERIEIRHLNGHRDDNHIANLVYGTVRENAADKIRHRIYGKDQRVA